MKRRRADGLFDGIATFGALCAASARRGAARGGAARGGAGRGGAGWNRRQRRPPPRLHDWRYRYFETGPLLRERFEKAAHQSLRPSLYRPLILAWKYLPLDSAFIKP